MLSLSSYCCCVFAPPPHLLNGRDELYLSSPSHPNVRRNVPPPLPVSKRSPLSIMRHPKNPPRRRPMPAKKPPVCTSKSCSKISASRPTFPGSPVSPVSDVHR
ncbi:hypothetical protein K456DRAFT_48545 [Colletotrichum gloeosporioides 23]|nr:hypothetical protein K456DRAFT_48545 [Colletotrichum gloeosporioides 23]